MEEIYPNCFGCKRLGLEEEVGAPMAFWLCKQTKEIIGRLGYDFKTRTYLCEDPRRCQDYKYRTDP
jgi:hypothetical protein